MDLTNTEREAIGLCVCLEAVNEIVNHALLDVRKSSRSPGEALVYFKDIVHRSLFIIRFLDFAKEAGDSRLTGVSGSCVDILDTVCANKSLGIDGSVCKLEDAVKELKNWLNRKAPMRLWLPTLDVNAEIEVSRIEFLKISGNSSKHNISRLTGVSKGIHRILSEHGYDVPIELIPLALEDFQEHLEQNYFIYYATWMAELLNEVRWGIQRYLEPLFATSHKPENDGFSYRFDYPDGITQEIAKQWFWRLMNHVRSGPYVDLFRTPSSLKEQSSLEWGL